MYVLSPDAETIRASMISYHQRAARPQMVIPDTQRERAREDARQRVHTEMADFWEHVAFSLEPSLIPQRQEPLTTEEEADLHARLGGRV